MTDTTTAQPAAAPAEPLPAAHPAGPVPASAPETAFFALPGRWNPLALSAFAAAFIAPVVAIVFGHLALRDLRWNGERGERIARWGLVLGYVFSALLVIGGIVAIVGMAHHGVAGGPRLGTGGFGGGTGNGFGGQSGNGFGNGFPGQGYGGTQGGTGN